MGTIKFQYNAKTGEIKYADSTTDRIIPRSKVLHALDAVVRTAMKDVDAIIPERIGGRIIALNGEEFARYLEPHGGGRKD